MDAFHTADRLEVLGVAVGVFLVLAGLGSLLGAPWDTNPNTLALLLQLLGIALSVAVGVALIALVRTE